MSDPISKIGQSRYARRVLAARPELAAELAAPAPFGRDEMLNVLRRTYIRARQAQITQEIAELVGGSAALEG